MALADPATAAAASVATRIQCMAPGRTKCSINSVAFMPEHSRVMTASSGGELTCWNTYHYTFERLFQGHDASAQVIRWNRGGTFLVTADVEANVRYWDPAMKLLEDFKAHRDVVRGIDFAPGDAKYVTCSDDGVVRQWDFASQSPRAEAEMRNHGSNVTGVAWHPVKSLVASCSRDGTIKLWDPTMGGTELLTLCVAAMRLQSRPAGSRAATHRAAAPHAGPTTPPTFSRSHGTTTATGCCPRPAIRRCA